MAWEDRFNTFYIDVGILRSKKAIRRLETDHGSLSVREFLTGVSGSTRRLAGVTAAKWFASVVAIQEL